MVESGDVDKNKKLPESETDMSIFYWLIFESDVDTLNTQDIWLLVVLDSYYVCFMLFLFYF